MSDSNGRCAFEHLDYCCIPDEYTREGFSCPSALPIEDGDITHKCGATDADLMTEGEWEARECCTNSDCHDDPSNEEDCRVDCPHMIFVKVPKGVPE